MAGGDREPSAESSDLLTEDRSFKPSEQFKRLAFVRGPDIRDDS